jgi:hypothetical protein
MIPVKLTDDPAYSAAAENLSKLTARRDELRAKINEASKARQAAAVPAGADLVVGYDGPAAEDVPDLADERAELSRVLSAIQLQTDIVNKLARETAVKLSAQLRQPYREIVVRIRDAANALAQAVGVEFAFRAFYEGECGLPLKIPLLGETSGIDMYEFSPDADARKLNALIYGAEQYIAIDAPAEPMAALDADEPDDADIEPDLAAMPRRGRRKEPGWGNG